MVTATRKQFIELEDGSVQFSVVVAPEDVVALLYMSPRPGCQIELSQFRGVETGPVVELPPIPEERLPKPGDFSRKPPTQTVAPAGENHVAFGPAGAREARQAIELCNNPWFQQYARAQRPDSKNPDDLEVAKGFMVTKIAPGGKWTAESVTLFQGVMKDYKAWCQGKGYTNG